MLATPAVKRMLRANATDTNSKTKVDALLKDVLDKKEKHVLDKKDQALIKDTLIAICKADNDKEGIIEEKAIGYKKVEALLDIDGIEKDTINNAYNVLECSSGLYFRLWMANFSLRDSFSGSMWSEINSNPSLMVVQGGKPNSYDESVIEDLDLLVKVMMRQNSIRQTVSLD